MLAIAGAIAALAAFVLFRERLARIQLAGVAAIVLRGRRAERAAGVMRALAGSARTCAARSRAARSPARNGQL
jgi:hypothetical protein